MFLHDKPETADVRFGHTIVSKWLAQEIVNAKTPIRIALTGALGTGKSTVLKMALDLVLQEDKNVQYAYVDVWKLDKESVRRSAIIKIAKEFRPNDYKAIDELRESAYGTRVENSKPKLFNTYWSLPGLFFSVFIGIVIYFISIHTFDLISTNNVDDKTKYLKHGISFVISLLAVLFKVLDKSIINIQKTISKSPMVGAEEFEECLKAILNSKDLKKKKKIIVFDNIDRATPSSSRAILAGISAFFDHTGDNDNVLIIVPFDPGCLQNDNTGDRPLSEDFEKMFDVIIPLPKLTSEDLSDFAFDILKQSLHDFNYKDEQLRDLAYLISFSPFKSPREIKHIINQLKSKLSMAKSLESQADPRLVTGVPLLPLGSVTAHPECLLKLLISEKIHPNIVENIVETGSDLNKVFNLDQDLRGLINSNSNQLSNYLHATQGIPKTAPQSASAFHYMKGPDQVISIPSGQAITDALYMGDFDKIKMFMIEDKLLNVTNDDITNIIRFYRKKYSKNSQALNNAVRCITIGFKDLKIFDRQTILELSELINISTNHHELNLIWLNKITIDFFELSSVQNLWRTLDIRFKQLLQYDLPETKDRQWVSDYLVAILGQPNGEERVLTGIKIPFAFLASHEVLLAMGDDYPKDYCTDDAIIKGTIKYLQTAKEEEDIFEPFVKRLYSLRNTPELDKNLNDLLIIWKNLAESWSLDYSASKGEKLSTVVYHLNSENGKCKWLLLHIKSWIDSNHLKLNEISKVGDSVGVIDLILAYYSFSETPDGQLNSILNNALSNITFEGFKELDLRYPDTAHTFNSLEKYSKKHLLLAIDRTVFFEDFFKTNTKAINSLINNFTQVKNKRELLKNLSEVETKEIELNLIPFGQYCNNELRPLFIKSAIKYNNNILNAIEPFIVNPDDSNEALITIINNLDYNLKKSVTNIAITHLMNIGSSWSSQNVQTFRWVNLLPDSITDTTLRDLVDKAIDKAIHGGLDEVSISNCTDEILTLWESEHAFWEKSFKILRKSANTKYQSRIKNLAKRYSIKDNMIEKAGNVLDKALSDDE